MMNTTVINFYGGPCSGKSTAAAGLFYKMKLAGLLSSGVAHNFNNILQAILGQATLVQASGSIYCKKKINRL